MPLLRQLEFAFRTVAGIADPGRFGTLQDAGVTAPGYNNSSGSPIPIRTSRILDTSAGTKALDKIPPSASNVIGNGCFEFSLVFILMFCSG